MFEHKTFDNIMEDMLKNVSSGFDKREGSIIYDALAPAAIEIAQLYADLDEILNQVFADTEERPYLIRRAFERGLVPYGESPAVLKGRFDIIVDIGARFNLDKLNYEVTDYIGEAEGYFEYKLKCEVSGKEGNRIGKLIPIDNISGLKYAEAVEILIYGDDEEETEDFRTRYFDSINNIAFGGNIADYKQKVRTFDGVGGVKVHRADDWLGAGTVKVVITSSDNTVPSEELINGVKEALDPSDYEGEGIGLAPIGHIVTVAGADSVSVDVKCKIYSDGTNPYLEDDLSSAFDKYIDRLNENWENFKNIVVYISHIISVFLRVNGVKDVGEVFINSAEENFSLPEDSIAVRGKFEAEVV